MGLFEFFFGEEELSNVDKLALISKRAKLIHTKKKEKRNKLKLSRKDWQASQNQAQKELLAEDKI